MNPQTAVYSLCFIPLIFCYQANAEILESPKYDKLKTEFLNVDSSYISEYDLSTITNEKLETLPTGKNSINFAMSGTNSYGWTNYGSNYLCGDDENPNAICRFVTGGNSGNNTPDCGTEVNTNYSIAATQTDKFCGNGTTKAPWSGFRLWIGAGYSDNFIESLFTPKVDFPVNRLCIEFEAPPEKIQYNDSKIKSNPALGQLVNPEVASPNLREMRINMGTYTSPYLSESGTTDEERGGTFHPGGTHFYHKPESYSRPPNDKVYALDEKTFVACMGPNPSNTRSGMRPSYNINPLMTVVGDNEEGKTDAYNYLNYVSRFYFILSGHKDSLASYPVTIKILKSWIMYERDDIFAFSGKGSVMSSTIIEKGDTAIHSFKLKNNAHEARRYQVRLMAGNTLALSKDQSYYRLYIDTNNNKQIDNVDTHILPDAFISTTPKTDINFLIQHTPNFDNNYETVTRHNRLLADASVLFLEEGRMRSASMAIRTWEGTASDVENKEAVLATLVYQEPNSDYEVYAEWNQDKPNNYRLIRNTPDYIKAIMSGPVFPPNFRTTK